MMKTPQPRLIPTKRTALDGLVWWVVFDTQTCRYSTRPCFGRYRRKKDCQRAIDYYTSDGYYDRQLAHLWTWIRQNGGKTK